MEARNTSSVSGVKSGWSVRISISSEDIPRTIW